MADTWKIGRENNGDWVAESRDVAVADPGVDRHKVGGVIWPPEMFGRDLRPTRTDAVLLHRQHLQSRVDRLTADLAEAQADLDSFNAWAATL